MKEIVVISGKGGTGKTSLVASFAALASNVVLADCDVDAADLHLVLRPRISSRNDFRAGFKAVINQDKCTSCGTCFDLCRFDAIKINRESPNENTYSIDPIACEGCGVCAYFCPEEAIEMNTPVCGEWYISDTRFGPMVHARLGVAEENSGKLVTLVRHGAKKIAEETEADTIIVDGPPGIGCPVIASITGADLVLIVTEPTVAGIHDLQRISQLTGHFKIPTFVCINKWDINPELAADIEENASKYNAEVIGKIHYDNVFTRAQVECTTVVEFAKNGVNEEIKRLWEQLSNKI